MYTNLKVMPSIVTAGQNVTVSATVTNSGNKASDEVGCTVVYHDHTEVVTDCDLSRLFKCTFHGLTLTLLQ